MGEPEHISTIVKRIIGGIKDKMSDRKREEKNRNDTTPALNR